MVRLQNRLINYQEQAQEINPPDVEALQQASQYEQIILERNRWRAWAANLEAEKEELQRRVREVERRRVQEAEELEEEKIELEEENREWRRRMEEGYLCGDKWRYLYRGRQGYLCEELLKFTHFLVELGVKPDRSGSHFVQEKCLIFVLMMTRTKKTDSVPSRMARLQNRLINYQKQAQEINPPDVEALRQASQYEQMILERNRWRAWAANLEAEKEELQRRIGEVERRRVQEAEELEEENRELEEENRE
ncbi:hypothetical protein C2G38_2044493 [Gigaspora rosea]|uniref:Uncharacterized protein n=1 Tax=Gigaspora rosea TaxID=44941 RepID=A0A397UQ12_9GLOM|nr:hypothetical protein C2G38_2044493 [Gigaspora rosea]